MSEKVADFAISLSRTLSICVVTVVAVNVSVEIPFVTSSPLSTIKPPSNLIRNCVSSGAVLDKYESFKASIASLNLSLIVSSSLFTRSDDKTLLSVSFVSASSFVTIIDNISASVRRDEKTFKSVADLKSSFPRIVTFDPLALEVTPLPPPDDTLTIAPVG